MALGAAVLPRLSSQELPNACKTITGLYPAGERVATLYDYRHYKMVMPPLVSKEAQSINCGGIKGTVYYFNYRTVAERDQAVLFARPVVTQDGPGTSISEWSTGFAVLSFRTPPQVLVDALEKKVSGVSTPALASPVTVPPPESDGVEKTTTLAVVETPPAIKAPTTWPPVEETRRLTVAKPVPPPPPVPPARTKAKENEPFKVVPPVMVTMGSQAPAEISMDVVATIASKLECDKGPTQAQAKTVCAQLQEFSTGLKPDWPLKAGSLYLGKAYTLDSYGRFLSLHYNVLGGTEDPQVASFFSYQSAGGTEDFELDSLVEAKKNSRGLPANAALSRLRDLAARKRSPTAVSNADRSVVLLPGGGRRVYLRKSGSHLVFVAPVGATAEEQKRGTFVIAVLH